MRRKQRPHTIRSTFFLAASLGIFLLLCPADVKAQDSESPLKKIQDLNVEVGAGADFLGKYIWRGQTLVDEPVFEPSAYLSADGFTASIWGNYTLTDEKEWTELDYTLDYTTSLEFVNPKMDLVSLSLGYIYYDFPNLDSSADSQEVYAGIAVDTLLSPSFTAYYDYDEGDGTYYELAVGHSVPIQEMSLDLSAAIGYNDGQWDYDSSFTAALLSVSLAIPLTDKISVAPGLYYSAALDNQYDDEFYGGFSIAIDL